MNRAHLTHIDSLCNELRDPTGAFAGGKIAFEIHRGWSALDHFSSNPRRDRDRPADCREAPSSRRAHLAPEPGDVAREDDATLPDHHQLIANLFQICENMRREKDRFPTFPQ